MTTSRRSPFRRLLILIAVSGIVPTLGACPKKEPAPVPDAEPPPPPVVIDAMVELKPIEEDAGVDADAADAKPRATGPATSSLASKVATCCAELKKQSKANGNPPEFAQAIAMCDATAAQLKTNPNAPELNALRPLLGMLSGVPACRSF